MNYSDCVELIKRHEGFRDRIYCDSVGVLTGGWGHAFIEGSKLPQQVCDYLLFWDVCEAFDDFNRLHLPLDPEDKRDQVRKFALVNMLFNLGLTRFLSFKKMIAALRRRDFGDAGAQALDSKWAQQVGKRAVEIADMISSGIYNG